MNIYLPRRIYFSFIAILCMLFFSCEGMAMLFHGPNPNITDSDGGNGGNGGNGSNGGNGGNGGGGGNGGSGTSEPSGTPVTPPGATLAEQLAYIRSNAGNGVLYDIVINNDEYIGPQSVSTMGKNIWVSIHSASSDDVKTIQLEGAGHLFSVDTGITLKLQDIVLRGHSTNNKALVAVGNGTLILNSGAKVTGNAITNNGEGGGVYVNGGVLEMNDGVEITQNKKTNATYTYGGGIFVRNGNVTIRGGMISENESTYGGGLYITGNSKVAMLGGVISKNQVNYGGGIYIYDSGSNFTKRSNPPGSSSSGIIYGGSGDDANTALDDTRGHAIYRNFGTLRKRNTTLGGYDEISTGNDVGWE